MKMLFLSLGILTLLGCTPLQMNDQQRAFIAAGGLMPPPMQAYQLPLYQMQPRHQYQTTCTTIGLRTNCTTR